MTKATPESSDSLVFECDFEEPPEKVWRALTEPELLKEWLTADDHPPAEPNAAGSDAADSESADSDSADLTEGRSVPYEILTADPHRLLRYRWRDRESGVGDSMNREVHSVVTVELVPGAEGGTHLRLTHGEFRIVSAAPSVTVTRVRPIASARRWRTRTISCTARSLRRAA